MLILFKDLNKTRALHDPSVSLRDGQPIGDIRDAFGRACKLAGVRNFRFHDFRHTAITNMRRAGSDHRASLASPASDLFLPMVLDGSGKVRTKHTNRNTRHRQRPRRVVNPLRTLNPLKRQAPFSRFARALSLGEMPLQLKTAPFGGGRPHPPLVTPPPGLGKSRGPTNAHDGPSPHYS